jgi:hypothetical protein
MSYIYYIDGEKFTTVIPYIIPVFKISSPNENTPALENLSTGYKRWCEKGYILHRLNGPSIINPNKPYWFHIKNVRYKNIHDWLLNHPIQDNAFQVEMLLKYT